MSAVLKMVDTPQDPLLACEPDWFVWPLAKAMRLRVVVACDAGQQWRALSPDVDDVLLHEAVARVVPHALTWQRIDEEALSLLLARGEQAFEARGALLSAGTDGAQAQKGASTSHVLTVDAISRQSSPVIKLLDATLFDALKAQASDLHLESTASGMVIRHRLDGVMLHVGDVGSREVAEQLVSRLKVMAELDIGERRLPQDGRFKLRVLQSVEEGMREVDFRVSIMPSSFGEDAVLRILDRSRLSSQAEALSLEGLGFDADDATVVRRLARKPYGMLLVTGPTGSGKTTTLYAVVQEINDGTDKIITIEDPVEYQLGGVVQIPVNDKKGLTFARGLRSILRHDPDRVMVGEIRDAETAQIASQAALTGHLVLSTIHANNVFDVVGRFMHMGVDLYNMVSALNGVVAQRLMRKLCTQCAQPWQPAAPDLKAAQLPLDTHGHFHRAVGCPACRQTGYRGRRAVSEILLMDDTLRDLIVSRASLLKIKTHARASGTRLLRESALAWVLRGESTLEELNRVTLVE
ncbi:MAG: type II/IV secretion system protein [Aquabacterium sp.]|uniref:GspE/PulE family protein n=1 Tax=Aquabacterium sp. TaxID=1872578 RepID=UPI00121939DC|nr:GspE/PulE family protein [Aquabacterium sp.]TAK96815.1 MAG: type II/IV secretion system protein [Aquabacterium sp.]